jgi:adenosylcobinamide-phosphate guanylyltransferase
MAVVGLIMAGGRAIRMGSETEKPLINFNGESMIKWVIKALEGASEIEEIVVATSPHTPKTQETAKELGLQVIETKGRDYISDAQEAIRKLIPKTVLVICSDLPSVSSQLIDEIIRQYAECGKPSLKVVTQSGLPKDSDQLNHSFEPNDDNVISAGINVIDSLHINEPQIDEAILLVESAEVGVNINTPEDLETHSQYE